MKKSLLLTIALGFASTGLANAAAIEIDGTSYSTLQEAITAATDGATIIINENLTDNRVTGTGGKTITIKGGADKITLSYTANGRPIMLNSGNQGVLHIENLTFDGQNHGNGTNSIFECGDRGVNEMHFTNVTIKNFTAGGDNGILLAKNGGKVMLSNVKFADCSVPVNRGYLTINNSTGCTISGDNAASIYFAGDKNIDATGVSNTTPVSIFLADYTAARVVVTGCNDTNQFTLAGNDNFELEASGDNLVVSNPLSDQSKMPVYNETMAKGYNDMKSALAEIASGNVLIVNENLDVVERITGVRNITFTIKGATKDIELICKVPNNNPFILTDNPSGVINIENITLNGNNRNSTQSVVKAGKQNSSIVNLKDVTIKNANIATGAECIINAWGNASINLENVEVVDCSVPDDMGLMKAEGTNNCSLKGNNTLSIKLFGDNTINASELTNTEKISLIFEDTRSLPSAAIIGWNTPSNFAVTTAGMKLETDGDNLNVVKDENTGIGDINVDENAPVEYYNLQGVRVENPENGLYIRRQGNTVTKVLVK